MFLVGRPSIQTTWGPAHWKCLQSLSLDPQKLPQPLAMMSHLGTRPWINGTGDYGPKSLKLWVWAQNRFFLLFLIGLRYFVLETSTFLSFWLSPLIPGNRAQEQPAFLNQLSFLPQSSLVGCALLRVQHPRQLSRKTLIFLWVPFPLFDLCVVFNCEPLNEGHGYVCGSAIWNSGFWMLRTFVQSEDKDVMQVLRPLVTTSSRRFQYPGASVFGAFLLLSVTIGDSKTSTACTKVPAWHPCWVFTVTVVPICCFCRSLTQPELEGRFRVKEFTWESNCLQKEKGDLYDLLTSRVRWAEKKFPLQWCVHF